MLSWILRSLFACMLQIPEWCKRRPSAVAQWQQPSLSSSSSCARGVRGCVVVVVVGRWLLLLRLCLVGVLPVVVVCVVGCVSLTSFTQRAGACHCSYLNGPVLVVAS